MTEAEVKERIAEHQGWLRGEAKARRADFSDEDLSHMDLAYAHLPNAVLINTNLFGANLFNANFNGADLYLANLGCIYAKWGDFTNARLRSASLKGADVSACDFTNSRLTYADLRHTNRVGANFSTATISRTHLPDSLCPEGEFIGYKKTTTGIVKVRIPASAKRVSPLGLNLCRAEQVVVVEGRGLGGWSVSNDIAGELKEGDVLNVDNFCDDIRRIYAPGIYFHMTHEEAAKFPT